MKQENNSTFSEGLVSDLNELSTPNNLLTDCVNGTLVTFNGNEFSLQNDMGNAKIPVTGIDPVKYVQLRENFYPIGVKEYGGVLYIVSAKKPTDASVYDSDKTDYAPGTFVKDNLGLFYYKCLEQFDEAHPLPTETNQYWELIGTLEDYNNYLGEVEIGSFPYPEFGSAVATLSTKESSISDLLYTQTIINDEIFKSGRYITFNDDTFSDSTGFSHYSSSSTYVPVFYKLKLWHQLTNGFYDLTNDVWEKYITYKSVNIDGNFWLNDSGFKYYCPYQYKGKLAISVEIEPSTFELVGDPVVETNYVNGIIDNYDITLNATSQTVGVITIQSATFNIYNENNILISGKSGTVNKNNGTYTYTFNLPAATYQEKLIRFVIVPNFSTIDIQLYPYTFPQSYINSYQIESSVYLEKGWSILIKPVESAYICDYSTKKAYTTKFVLTDLYGSNVDITGNASSVPYTFVANGCSDPQYVGNYVDNNAVNATYNSNTERVLATYNKWSYASGDSTFQYINSHFAADIADTTLSDNFRNVLKSKLDINKCGTTTLTINLNHPIDLDSLGDQIDNQIVVKQEEIPISSQHSSVNPSIFVYKLDISKAYIVDINIVYNDIGIESETYFDVTSQSGAIKPYYPIHYGEDAPLSTSVTKNFALISRLEGDYGICRTDTSVDQLQLIGFHFNTFLYSGHGLPGTNYLNGGRFISPKFSINYNNGIEDTILENKTISWIPESEQYNSLSFLEYKFRELNSTAVNYQLVNSSVTGKCISITDAGTGSENKLLSDNYNNWIIADNISDRSKYYVVPVGYHIKNQALKTINYIFAKDYVLGTPTVHENAGGTTYYSLTEGTTDFVGSPVFIRKRKEWPSPTTPITITGSSTIDENAYATYSVETFKGVVEWIVTGVTIIEYPTATSVKVKANNIDTDPAEHPTNQGLIMVLDSLGNYGTIKLTINNLA
jgi:hypothetical protein